MNIDKYMKKAYGFLAKTSKEQSDKAEKLEEILAKLTVARKKLNKEITKTTSKEKKLKKQEELVVLTSLIKKTKKRLKKLSRNKE